MSTTPFDIPAQTKAATDQLLTLVSQGQQATLASVKTLSGLAAPVLDKVPTVPFAPAPAELKSVIDSGFAALTTILESQKAFATDLLDLLVPGKPVAAAKK